MYFKAVLLTFCVLVIGHGGLCERVLGNQHTVNGEPPSRLSPYIMEGVEVEGREFPGIASVHRLGYHYCTGSIINSEWVLTIAGCMMYDPHLYYVLVGTNHIDNGGTSHPVTEVIIHEAYNESDSWINDIALLKLHKPIKFDENVASVKLPEKGEEIPVGTTGTMAGWGALEYYGPTANDMHKVDIEIYDREKCQEAYAPINKHIYPTQICAAAEEGGKGPTNGDGAAPFMVNGVVIGLASWERNKNQKGYPVVMTKIHDYIDWINSHVVD